MADLYRDCTTQDLEYLQAYSNRLMLAFQAMQVEVTKDLSVREQMIVINASLTQLQAIAERSAKKMTTPRFVRSIRTAVLVARKFGTGNFKPPSE